MKNKRGMGLVEGVIIIVLLVVLGTLVLSIVAYGSKRAIPLVSVPIQKGYAIPSKLKPLLTDVDNNKEYELVLEYEGVKYLLTLDDKGKPQLKEFQVKSSEIVLK